MAASALFSTHAPLSGHHRSLVERLVGSVLVVVVDVAGDKALKLVLVPDNRCVWCPETRSLLVRRHFGTRV